MWSVVLNGAHRWCWPSHAVPGTIANLRNTSRGLTFFELQWTAANPLNGDVLYHVGRRTHTALPAKGRPPLPPLLPPTAGGKHQRGNEHRSHGVSSQEDYTGDIHKYDWSGRIQQVHNHCDTPDQRRVRPPRV